MEIYDIIRKQSGYCDRFIKGNWLDNYRKLPRKWSKGCYPYLLRRTASKAIKKLAEMYEKEMFMD